MTEETIMVSVFQASVISIAIIEANRTTKPIQNSDKPSAQYRKEHIECHFYSYFLESRDCIFN